jgi:hypothetical protein
LSKVSLNLCYRGFIAGRAAEPANGFLPLDVLMILYVLRSQSGDLGKTGGIGDGEISQHFAIQLNAGLFKPAHEFAVGEIIHPGSRIDPDNPQAPEISLAGTAIAIGIHEGLVDRIRRGSEKFTVTATKPFGQLQDLLSSSSGFETPFDTHGLFSLNLESCLACFNRLEPA